MLDVGGRTVFKLWDHVIPVLSRLSHGMAVLEISPNDRDIEEPLLPASFGSFLDHAFRSKSGFFALSSHSAEGWQLYKVAELNQMV